MTTTPGPRQTVNRAIHPTLGPGIAVSDNGPAFFLADSGEVLHSRSIGLGGASSDPRRSWVSITVDDGTVIELDTTDQPRGDTHRRYWHPMHGAGWLVMLSRKVERAIAMRFDPDEGRPFEMIVHVLQVGTPDYARRSDRARTKAVKMTDEEQCWATYTLASGETIAFRDEPPPSAATSTPAPTAETPTSPAQRSLFPR